MPPPRKFEFCCSEIDSGGFWDTQSNDNPAGHCSLVHVFSQSIATYVRNSRPVLWVCPVLSA